MPGRSDIAGLVLAAGLSRRMGGPNKLLQPLEGKPVLLHAVDALKRSMVGSLLVVTGHERRRVEDLLTPIGISCIHNPNYEQGLSSSLRCGVENLGGDLTAVLVSLGDMPWTTPAVIDKIVGAFSPMQGREIIVPTWKEERGHPVLFSRRFFTELMALEGDVGGRAVIAAHPERVFLLPVNEKGVVMDVDRPGDLLPK